MAIWTQVTVQLALSALILSLGRRRRLEQLSAQSAVPKKPTLPVAGFHRRALPSPAIAMSSEEGRRLHKEAMAGGGMEIFFRLAEAFHTQAEPAYCGLGTLVTVLNALEIVRRLPGLSIPRPLGFSLSLPCYHYDLSSRPSLAGPRRGTSGRVALVLRIDAALLRRPGGGEDPRAHLRRMGLCGALPRSRGRADPRGGGEHRRLP